MPMQVPLVQGYIRVSPTGAVQVGQAGAAPAAGHLVPVPHPQLAGPQPPAIPPPAHVLAAAGQGAAHSFVNAYGQVVPPVPRVRFEQPAQLDHIPPDLSDTNSRTYRRYMRTHLRKRDERDYSAGLGEAPWLDDRSESVQAITGTMCTGMHCRGANTFSHHCGRRPQMCRKCCTHMELAERDIGHCKDGMSWEEDGELHRQKPGGIRGSRY